MKTLFHTFLRPDRSDQLAGAAMKAGAAFGILACIVAGAAPGVHTARAQETPEAQPERYSVRVEYVVPKNSKHQPLYELLKERGALESLQQLLAPFRWPRTLTVKLEGCDGEANAWYEDASVTVCYEYLDDVWRNAPKKTTAAGLAPIDAVLGPLFDVFLHESGHALFDLLKIPILGREEDAADQVSTYIMLQLGKEEARRLVLGTAHAYKVEFERSVVPYVLIGLGLVLITIGALMALLWMIGSGAALAISVALYLALTSTYGARQQFADEHGTPAQRFYNLLCIAYGADPSLFADLAEKQYLPEDRAEGCADEYRQVATAFNTLIVPHMDQEASNMVMKRTWLPDVNTGLPRRTGSGRILRPIR
jgi:Putative metallopeptidase